MENIFQNVDWQELAEQKKSLKIVTDTLGDKSYDVVHKHMPKLKFNKKEHHIENLNKLLAFINKIQDAAVENGVKLSEVYPIAQKVNLVIGVKKNVN